MSTLPKSIQAAQNMNIEGQPNSEALRIKRQAYREFADEFKTLPDNFLRVTKPANPQGDAALAQSVQQTMNLAGSDQMAAGVQQSGALVDVVDISIVEAQLLKNYGLLRMDLYCKIRVGHMVCETQTCPNGAKNPKWDGVYQFSLKPGIDSFHLEIYDEKQFSPDEKIAWLHEPIPPEVFQGITVERWYPLSGRLGQHKEGSVLLVVSHKRVPMRASHLSRSLHHLPPGMRSFFANNPQQQIIGHPTVVPIDPSLTVPTYIGPPPAPNQPQTNNNPNIVSTPQRRQNSETRTASEEDINQLSEMFPSIDKAIIKAILENNQHDKEASIGALLAMG